MYDQKRHKSVREAQNQLMLRENAEVSETVSECNCFLNMYMSTVRKVNVQRVEITLRFSTFL